MLYLLSEIVKGFDTIKKIPAAEKHPNLYIYKEVKEPYFLGCQCSFWYYCMKNLFIYHVTFKNESKGCKQFLFRCCRGSINLLKFYLIFFYFISFVKFLLYQSCRYKALKYILFNEKNAKFISITNLKNINLIVTVILFYLTILS